MEGGKEEVKREGGRERKKREGDRRVERRSNFLNFVSSQGCGGRGEKVLCFLFKVEQSLHLI